MIGVFDSIKLRMLWRADYVREPKLLRDSHVHSHKTVSIYINLGGKQGGHIVCSLSICNSMESKTTIIHMYLFFKIPSHSSAAESRLYEMFKATDKLSYVLIVELSKLSNSNKK